MVLAVGQLLGRAGRGAIQVIGPAEDAGCNLGIQCSSTIFINILVMSSFTAFGVIFHLLDVHVPAA